MVIIDIKSRIDITSRLSPNQARKILTAILNRIGVSQVFFTKHCREEMQNDFLAMGDIINVLMAGYIYEEPEFIAGTYRYRVETSKILVVFIFEKPANIRCITAWRKKR